MMNNSQNDSQFIQTVWEYYTIHKRMLPWRETKNPYHILVSEVMLQQTQVSQVLSKYDTWIQKFPNLESLSSSPLEEVLRSWSGLGYNRRALNLCKTAQKLTEEFAGKIPHDPKLLETFPGIGKNTAAAVIVFSYNVPLVFIETNIRRVFIHEFFKDKTDIHDKKLFPLIEQTLDTKNPRTWYYALMDYGTHLGKTIINPNRKSAHYKKQSKLKGSVREARGRIITILLNHSPCTKQKLEELARIEKKRFETALIQLKREGFITIKHNKILLR